MNGSEVGLTAADSDDSHRVSTDLEPLDFAGLLDMLGFDAGDRLGLTAEAKNRCGVAERDRVIKVAAENTHTDCWFGVNPTTCTREGGRGNNAEVSRLAALVADLDDEKMSRAGTDAIIAEISELIGWPSAITESGHGRQPYWPLDRSDAEQLSNGEAAALAERFGILIARLAAGKRGTVDSVGDLARMLRVPGSTNRKKPAAPQPVTCRRDRRGAPVKIAVLLAGLDAEKIPAVDPAEALRDVVSAPADWTFTAGMECKWLATKIAAWPTDEIRSTRHNWLGAAATHVACCRRRGCIGDHDLDAIRSALESAFMSRLAQEPTREPDPPTEFADWWRWGEARAACMSDAEVMADTGAPHHHDLAADAEDDGHDFSQYRLEPKLQTTMTDDDKIGDDGSPPAGDDAPQADQDDTTWAPQDLGRWMAGGFECPQPTMGMARNDGQRFIYPGREHAFVGETESGKTWLALACAAAEILAGGLVVYIHYEEGDPGSTIERLRLLGIDDARTRKQLRFLAPYKPPKPEWIAALLEPVPTMVIHDGVNEAMSLMGANTDKVDGASEFRRRLVTPFLRAGAASIACDHVAKDRESRGRDAYGSVHKGNALDGARIALETVKPFGRGLRGVSYVYVTKDRPGQLRVHGTADEKTPGKTYIGTLVADDEQMFTPFSLMLYAPKPEEPADDEHRAIAVQDDVYGVIFEQPDHTVDSQRKLFAVIRAAGYQFRESDIRRAVEDLVVMKSVVEIKGRNKAVGYQAIPSAARGSEDEC